MRKKFLVKPNIQLHHLMWTLITVLVSCVLGYVLFETMIRSVLINKGIMGYHLDQIILTLREGFSLILIILLAAIGLENYLLFHKFIGPLYALEKAVKKMISGDYSSTTKIRDSDQLVDLISAFESLRIEIKKVLEKKNHDENA